MPVNAAPTVFGSAVRAWVDTFRAVVAMPWVTGIGFALLIGLGLAVDLLPPLLRSAEPETFGESLIWSGAAGIVESFLTAPLAIAIHRHVILGEVTQSYVFRLSDHRFLRFFYFSFTLALAQTILIFIAIQFFPESFSTPVTGDVKGPGFAVTMAIMFGILIVLGRLILVFPAAAVDAPGATWGNAWRATQGHFWTIVFVFVVVTVPAISVWLFATSVLDFGKNSTFEQTWFMLYEMPTLCAYAAAASRLYQVYDGPLGGPSGELRA